MDFIGFFAGFVIGGLLVAIACHLYYQGKCDKESLESYTRGYQAASDCERIVIIDLIEQLANRSTTCDPADDESPEGSDD